MTELLYCCAGIQIFVAALNLTLPRLLGWRPALDALPDLVREVFHVHSLFVSFTLVLFAWLTIRFAGDVVCDDEQAVAIARCIAAFWSLRVGVQLFCYSPAHHRGKYFETFVHFALLLVYGGMSIVYWVA